MQLSTKFLKKLIKEELESFLSDEEETEEDAEAEESTEGGFKFKRDPNAAQAAVEDGFKTNEAPTTPKTRAENLRNVIFSFKNKKAKVTTKIG